MNVRFYLSMTGLLQICNNNQNLVSGSYDFMSKTKPYLLDSEAEIIRCLVSSFDFTIPTENNIPRKLGSDIQQHIAEN